MLATVGLLTCAVRAAANTSPAEGGRVATSLPLPTAPQLAYQRDEIMALIHFNMATFFRNGVIAEPVVGAVGTRDACGLTGATCHATIRQVTPRVTHPTGASRSTRRHSGLPSWTRTTGWSPSRPWAPKRLCSRPSTAVASASGRRKPRSPTAPGAHASLRVRWCGYYLATSGAAPVGLLRVAVFQHRAHAGCAHRCRAACPQVPVQRRWARRLRSGRAQEVPRELRKGWHRPWLLLLAHEQLLSECAAPQRVGTRPSPVWACLQAGCQAWQ